MWDPMGPMENGITYIVRPRMQPSKRRPSVARIWAGSSQLFVGPASSFFRAANEGAILHARDIGGVRTRQEALRAQFFVQPEKGPGIDQLAAQAVIFLLGPVAPYDALGLGELRDLLHPVAQATVAYIRGCVGNVGALVFHQVRSKMKTALGWPGRNF